MTLSSSCETEGAQDAKHMFCGRNITASKRNAVMFHDAGLSNNIESVYDKITCTPKSDSPESRT